MTHSHPLPAARPQRLFLTWLWPLGIVGGLTLIFGLVNWHWLGVNIVTYGWDRMDHLITSLVYNDILRTITPESLFRALVYSNYYPPLVHYGVWTLYQFFGINEDVAVMVNIPFLLVLLAATWFLAERMGGKWVAALAVGLLGLFPMIFAMSRYLYLDFALTAMVALALAALPATHRFTRGGASCWFGLLLGLTFLVKWTAAAFLIGPLLYLLWRSGVLTALLQQRRVLHPSGRRLAITVGVSGIVTALWFIPARNAVVQSPLGDWIFPLAALFTTGMLYALFTKTVTKPMTVRPLLNALRAGAIASWVMSFWYVPNVEFITSFFHTAYGLEDGRFWAYDKYFYEVTTEQIGPFLSVIFALVVLVFLWQRRTRLHRLLTNLDDTAWILLLWAVVPTIIFSSRVSLAHSRFLMPFLPPFAIWLAYGLWQWRGRLTRGIAITLVLLVAIAQFALISFDSLAPWRAPLHLQLASGPVNLLAHGFFIQYPASEETDPGYAIAPAILDVVEQARVDQGRERINLGILVNSYQFHEKHFLYQIYTKYWYVTLRELARNWHNLPAYNQLFDMDFVLVNDTHTYRTNEASQGVVQRILTQPADLFNLAFRPVQQWTLPNGEVSTLYERRFAPTEPGFDPANYGQLLHEFGDDWGPGDLLVLTAPEQAYILGLTLPADHRLTILPLPADDKPMEESLDVLAHLAQSHDRIFLLSHNEAVVDPQGAMERWLRSHLTPGPASWINALRVTPFVAASLPTTPARPLRTRWQGGAELAGIAVDQAGLHPQGAVTAKLFWQSIGATPQKVSLQLFGPDGALVAQQDADLAATQAPFVLLLPRTLAPGAYQLVVILYDPTTLQRDQLIADGETAGGDALELLSFPLP